MYVSLHLICLFIYFPPPLFLHSPFFTPCLPGSLGTHFSRVQFDRGQAGPAVSLHLQARDDPFLGGAGGVVLEGTQFCGAGETFSINQATHILIVGV